MNLFRIKIAVVYFKIHNSTFKITMPFTLAISETRTPFLKNKWLIAFTLIFSGIWLSTIIGTSNMSNWFLENTLVIFFLIFLIATYKKFQFSDLSYVLICVYLCLHIYGAKYTYAENPFGYWLKDTLHLERNHYDRIVHFSFGFLLAYVWREFFLMWMKFPTWVSWALPIEITLSISGLYELVEWAVADIFFPAQGVAYLGTQGDIWDAQKDMFVATLGAIVATTIVSSIKKLLTK
jgi:putative membrane protein